MAQRHKGRYRLSRIALVATLVMVIAGPVGAQGPAADAQQQWRELMGQVEEAYRAGDYANGAAVAERAYQLARQTFGPRHPDTLKNLNSLAFLYYAQGRYGEAEPFHKEVLQARRETLGPRHPDTLLSLGNLALLYKAQGRYGEAEPLLKEVLQASREVLGPRHPDTLGSLNLAGLYHEQGRYGEAEPLYKEALPASLGNLAGLYREQGRYGEAEPLLKEVLQASREVLGPRHPDTLLSLNNLAALYDSQGRYGEAGAGGRRQCGRCRRWSRTCSAGSARNSIAPRAATYAGSSSPRSPPFRTSC